MKNEARRRCNDIETLRKCWQRPNGYDEEGEDEEFAAQLVTIPVFLYCFPFSLFILRHALLHSLASPSWAKTPETGRSSPCQRSAYLPDIREIFFFLFLCR